jgi:enamine deaminase RidA (YjgF/YER057c/UK114 family)
LSLNDGQLSVGMNIRFRGLTRVLLFGATQNQPERSSAAVIFGDLVFLSGQVGAPGSGVREQTLAILARIDHLLAQTGSDKSRILQAII